MQIITTIKSLRTRLKAARKNEKSIGFVPTMGYLHEGHLSLIDKSRKENDLTVLNIFVNPKQFAPGEDLDRYPRDKKRDELLAKKSKVDIIFYPSEKEMYPSGGYLTYVTVEKLSNVLCGHSRPGHFKGVATVVTKLLNIVAPDTLYLGQKDAQQAVILKRMVDDLNLPVKVRIMPIVRERDGLAMSSRNSYLSAQERTEAGALHQALKAAKQAIIKGERDTGHITALIKKIIRTQSSGRIDYVACVSFSDLEPLAVVKGKTLIATAAWFGKTRLIDNIVVTVK